MMRRRYFAALLVAATMGTATSAEKPAAPVPAAKATKTQVIAYYFHATIRCETCLKIEKQAREAIEARFPVEMAEKRLVFKAVNYDKPENAHFLRDYKLPCPSLVVVRQKAGKDEKWKLLDKTWEHVENPFKFNEYVELRSGSPTSVATARRRFRRMAGQFPEEVRGDLLGGQKACAVMVF